MTEILLIILGSVSHICLICGLLKIQFNNLMCVIIIAARQLNLSGSLNVLNFCSR